MIGTVSYALAPGIILDGEIGYTWYRDTHDAKPDETDSYDAFSVAVGTALTF